MNMKSAEIIKLLSSPDPEIVTIGIKLFQDDYDWRRIMYYNTIIKGRSVDNWNSVVCSMFKDFKVNFNHPRVPMIEYNKRYNSCFICRYDEFLAFVKYYYEH